MQTCSWKWPEFDIFPKEMLKRVSQMLSKMSPYIKIISIQPLQHSPILKLADVMTLSRLINSNNGEQKKTNDAAKHTKWCHSNHLDLNANQTKKLITDSSRSTETADYEEEWRLLAAGESRAGRPFMLKLVVPRLIINGMYDFHRHFAAL